MLPMQVLTIVMEQGSAELKLKAVDILLSMVSHDPRPLRDFLLSQPNQTLFGQLIQCATLPVLLVIRAQQAGACAGPRGQGWRLRLSSSWP